MIVGHVRTEAVLPNWTSSQTNQMPGFSMLEDHLHERQRPGCFAQYICQRRSVKLKRGSVVLRDHITQSMQCFNNHLRAAAL